MKCVWGCVCVRRKDGQEQGQVERRRERARDSPNWVFHPKLFSWWFPRNRMSMQSDIVSEFTVGHMSSGNKFFSDFLKDTSHGYRLYFHISIMLSCIIYLKQLLINTSLMHAYISFLNPIENAACSWLIWVCDIFICL